MSTVHPSRARNVRSDVLIVNDAAVLIVSVAQQLAPHAVVRPNRRLIYQKIVPACA